MHRFFENQQLYINQQLYLNSDNSHKIISVLRLSKDQQIILFNNTNVEFIARIIDIRSKLICVIILGSTFKDLNSPLKIHLAQAVTKHDHMDWIVQKAVELGVDQITPIMTDRTIAKPKDPAKKKLHWENITIAACCQCGRNSIPTINNFLSLRDFISKYSNLTTYKFILSPVTNNNAPYQTLAQLPNNFDYHQELLILIGPEGGFNQEELNLANHNLFTTLNVGPRILRSETAPIVILSILQAHFGDL